MVKNIEIDGQTVAFKATAAIPRLYRIKFNRDIYTDLTALQKNLESSKGMDIASLEVFENLAFIMAKHADSSIPDTPEEWLEEFSTFSIYQILPQLIELWGMNTQTNIKSKKK